MRAHNPKNDIEGYRWSKQSIEQLKCLKVLDYQLPYKYVQKFKWLSRNLSEIFTINRLHT